MTLIELIIVMAMISVVMAVAGAGFISLSETAKSTQDKAEATVELRQAMELMIRNIRAAKPIEERTPVSDYDRRISFKVFCAPAGTGTCDSAGQRHLVYRVVNNGVEVVVNGAVGTITRPEATSFPAAQSRFAIVNTAAEPVFRYYRADGARITTDGSAAPSRFRDCTKTVQIHLRMIAESGNTANPVSLVTRVTLRNFNSVTGCIATTTTT